MRYCLYTLPKRFDFLQLKDTRIILVFNQTHTKPFYAIYFDKLRSLYKFVLVCLMHRIGNGETGTFQSFFERNKDIHNHNKRQNEHYDILSFPPWQWRHNDREGVSNHRRIDCLLNRLFSRRSKKTPKLRVTGLCEGDSPGTDEFHAQRASNGHNVSFWWRHHARNYLGKTSLKRNGVVWNTIFSAGINPSNPDYIK